MISNKVKSAFKVEKLHPIPRIREFKDKRKERKDLDHEWRSKNLLMSDD